MKNKLKSIYSTLLLFGMSTFIYAQMEGEEPNVPCPTCPVEGDGTLKTPIDEYTIYLIGLAIMLALVYFTINKYKKSLI